MNPPSMLLGASCIRVVVASLEVTESRASAVSCRVLEVSRNVVSPVQ